MPAKKPSRTAGREPRPPYELQDALSKFTDTLTSVATELGIVAKDVSDLVRLVRDGTPGSPPMVLAVPMLQKRVEDIDRAFQKLEADLAGRDREARAADVKAAERRDNRAWQLALAVLGILCTGGLGGAIMRWLMTKG